MWQKQKFYRGAADIYASNTTVLVGSEQEMEEGL